MTYYQQRKIYPPVMNDPSMWPKANPNIGCKVSYKNYRNGILAKCFGIPMGGEENMKEVKGVDNKLAFIPKRINFRKKKGNYYTDVLWEDGTVTVVKLRDGEDFDEYAAFCAALAKKVFGSTNAVNTIVKKTACYPLTKAQKKNVERKEEVDRMDAEYRKE